MGALLQMVTDDIFDATTWLKMMPGWYFSIRMTILRLPSGDLIVHSPLKPTPELLEEVKALGRVAYLVAPNTFHHLYVGHWKAAFPDAMMLGPKGLRKKREDLSFDGFLNDPLPESWNGIVTAVPIMGLPAVQEVVLHHGPSQTLLATDLLFNMHETKGLMSPLVFAMMGCSHPPAQSRALKFICKDKPAAWGSVNKLLELDFKRLIMCHGEIIDEGAKDTIAEVCAWMQPKKIEGV